MFDSPTLFASDTSFQPLAHKLRPTTVDGLVAIPHATGDRGAALYSWLKSVEFNSKANKNCRIQSILLWGPPGTGKTTIAQLIAELTDKEFVKLHAFDSGVKDLREIIAKAKKLPNTIILFVDEVHNFNRSQQDVLLDAIETGILTFIGATTENPAVSINKALTSRLLKFELKSHRYEDHEVLIERACSEMNKTIADDAKDFLIKASYGDARTLLTYFEQAALQSNAEDADGVSEIRLDLIKEITDQKQFSGDPNTYYDCISALQKAMRGSDPDASIYWLARLLNAGAELKQVCRRIVVTASEDVGLADPQALVLAQSAYEAAMHLGMPEARIPLAQAVSYIAKAPKCNAAYMALNRAMRDCRNHPPYEVPTHLRPDNSMCPAKNLQVQGVNPVTDYKYPHDYPGHYVEQEYMPPELKGKKYLDK